MDGGGRADTQRQDRRRGVGVRVRVGVGVGGPLSERAAE